MINQLFGSKYLATVVVIAMFLTLTKAATSQQEISQQIRISSFNIHYISPRQKKLAWDNRKEAVKLAIADIDADIIAFQEMETFAGGRYNTQNKQLDWVLNHFPMYQARA